MQIPWNCGYFSKNCLPSQNDPKSTTKTNECSKELANIFVYESTVLKTLNKQGVYGRTPKRRPLLTKKNIAACLTFAKEHIDTPQWYWENVLWPDETKTELYGKNTQHYIWRKKGTAYRHENIIPTGKYGGGNIMIWACFSASGPGRQLAVIEGKMNFQEKFRMK